MESVEKTAKTLDDAIDAALDELDLDEDQVQIEVLADGSDGNLARVRVTPNPDAYEDDAEDEEEEDEAVGLEEDVVSDPAASAAAAEGEEGWDENLATAGREILEDLLDFMGFPGEVDVLRAGKENGTPTIAMAVVDGDSMGALIGRRGETLQALQFICQLLVNRRVGHWTRIMLDVEGYRSRRERYLKDTALRAAERAVRYGEPIELDPMIPSERRIVHMALADHAQVTTHSEGEGDNRRIIVEPKAEFARPRSAGAGDRERGGRGGPNRGGGFARGGRPGGRGRGAPAGGGFGRR